MLSLTVSATGLMDAQVRMNAAASNIAVANVPPPLETTTVTSTALPNNQGVVSYVQTKESVFGVDMVSEATSLKLASLSFAANAKAVKVANSTVGTLIDMVDNQNTKS